MASLELIADSPPASHRAFENAFHVDGNDPKAGTQATFRVERGPSNGPFRTGSEYRLSELDPVTTLLAREFP
ncbi:MAG: hypothetical protein ABR888_04555 [Thermoplasmata archaeon]